MTDRAIDRTFLAGQAQAIIDKMIGTVYILMVCFNARANMMSMGSPGITMKGSIKSISACSNLPRNVPASKPTSSPTCDPIRAVNNPIYNEFVKAFDTAQKTGLPLVVVPKIKSKDDHCGGLSLGYEYHHLCCSGEKYDMTDRAAKKRIIIRPSLNLLKFSKDLVNVTICRALSISFHLANLILGSTI
jgi:hypothetical protein